MFNAIHIFKLKFLIFRIVPICYYYLIKLSVFIGDNVISLQSLTTEKTKVELIYFRNAGGFLEMKTI